uniref:G protein-coupled receptor n=1 Tax=Steinernema glaseri TaxID=37863 RepID=A0A1I7Z7B4_9BILA
MATIISPSSLTFVLVTILLSFNRFVLFCLPHKENQIFSPLGNKVLNYHMLKMMTYDQIWLAIVIAFYTFFAALQMSNRVYTYYDVETYKWSYDSSYPWTDARANIVMVYQLAGIFFAFCLYIAISLKLWRVRRELGSSSSFQANRKILIQAVVIMVYCTAQIFLWHEIDADSKKNKEELQESLFYKSLFSPIVARAINGFRRTRETEELGVRCCFANCAINFQYELRSKARYPTQYIHAWIAPTMH